MHSFAISSWFNFLILEQPGMAVLKISSGHKVFIPVTRAIHLLVRIKSGGIGPFAGGYGFGARSTLLGYFLRVDVAWEMNGVFRGKPSWYFAMGFDF